MKLHGGGGGGLFFFAHSVQFQYTWLLALLCLNIYTYMLHQT